LVLLHDFLRNFGAVCKREYFVKYQYFKDKYRVPVLA